MTIKQRNFSLMQDEHEELNRIQLWYKLHRESSSTFNQFLEKVVCTKNSDQKIEANCIEVSLFGSEYELNIDDVYITTDWVRVEKSDQSINLIN